MPVHAALPPTPSFLINFPLFFLLFFHQIAAGVATTNAATGKDFLSDMRAIVPLTAENYATAAEGIKIGCVIAFGKGPVNEDEYQETADGLDGFGRVTYIDMDKEEDLMGALDLTWETAPAFRAKAIGEGKQFEDFETLEEASASITENIPDGLCEVFPDERAFHPFLAKTLQEGALSVILLSDKSTVPKLFQKLALWMGDLFSYAVFANPNEEVLKQFGVEKVPQIMVMLPQPKDEADTSSDGAQYQFQPIPYQRKQFGGLKFKNVIRFLATVQQELTQQGYFEKMGTFNVPGAKEKKKAEQAAPKSSMVKMVPLYENTAETPEACAAGKLGLCVIGLLDGSPPNDDQRAEQLAILTEVQKLPSNKGRPLHFMWVDLSCHPSFGEYFGLSLENAPTLVAVSPKKALYANYYGPFATKKIGTFIAGVLAGKNRIAALPGSKTVPVISADDDCAAVHASMTPDAEEDDAGMDDIMAEMRAEEEAKAAAEEAEAAANPIVDHEMEEKKRKAQAEMDKLNKASNKHRKKSGGKKKKKKKGKKGKKGSKKKAEL